jgi:hypothetical protein
MQYFPKDIDLWIECAREWVRSTGIVPGSLLITFDRMTDGNLTLSIYGHHRILKYPTLKRAVLKAQHNDYPDDEDESPVYKADPLKTPMQRDSMDR